MIILSDYFSYKLEKVFFNSDNGILGCNNSDKRQVYAINVRR